MVGLGVIDDRRGTSALAKLTAQIFIAGILVLLGVQLAYFVLPGEGLAVLGTDEAVPLTILWVLAAANAINLVDGLDGLAAGMVAIAATTFFVYLVRGADVSDSASVAALLSAITVGICRGLPPLELPSGEDLHGRHGLDAPRDARGDRDDLRRGQEPGAARDRGTWR